MLFVIKGRKEGRNVNIIAIIGNTIPESIVAPIAYSNDALLLKCLATK
jgi:hypothetical protein